MVQDSQDGGCEEINRQGNEEENPTVVKSRPTTSVVRVNSQSQGSRWFF